MPRRTCQGEVKPLCRINSRVFLTIPLLLTLKHEHTDIIYLYYRERERCPALQQHRILGRSNSSNKALGQPPGRPPDMGEDHDVTPASHHGGDAASCACCRAQPCDTLIQLHTHRQVKLHPCLQAGCILGSHKHRCHWQICQPREMTMMRPSAELRLVF